MVTEPETARAPQFRRSEPTQRKWCTARRTPPHGDPARVAAGGCSGSDSEPTSDPTPTTATRLDQRVDRRESPTASAEPSVEPASGPLLDAGSATINLPEGWKDNGNDLPNTYSGSDKKGGAHTRLITVVDLASINSGYSIAKQARHALTLFPGAKLTVQPPVELDGEPAYHVAGTERLRGQYDEVGLDSHGRELSIGFGLNGYTDAERQEIIDSVIASFHWKV